METHTVAVQPESVANDATIPRQDAVASVVGIAVLAYVVLLYAFAPRRHQNTSRRISL